MTRLLISVRDASEARLALEAGVDLIDLKEPSAGALGAVAPSIANEVVALVAGRVPVSMACGELLDSLASGEGELPEGMAYAKLGLAGCADRPDWPRQWGDRVRRFSPTVNPVAVAYVDAVRAGSPQVLAVIEHTAKWGARALLLDTCHKDRGGLLDWLSVHELRGAIAAARGRQMLVVLGGSLDARSIEAVLPLEPDVVAVRGAACRGGRQGPIDREKLFGLVRLLRCEKNTK